MSLGWILSLGWDFRHNLCTTVEIGIFVLTFLPKATHVWGCMGDSVGCREGPHIALIFDARYVTVDSVGGSDGCGAKQGPLSASFNTGARCLSPPQVINLVPTNSTWPHCHVTSMTEVLFNS